MIYATNGDREPKVPVRDLMQKNLAVYAMSLAGVPHLDRRRAQSDIAAWTATPGRILSVAARFPLLETAGATRRSSMGARSAPFS
jgi:NADPH2:quinone reductase